MDQELVFDVDGSDFETRVIERSMTVPVAIDFWAEWCGPCRVLGPLLERLAVEHGGAFEVAKVDIDKAPDLADAFGVTSVPMVLGLRDGRPVASFVGALPEEAVREFLARLLPTPAETLAGEAALARAAGRASEAEEMFGRALQIDPRCAAAALGLAGLRAERGEAQEALDLLATIEPGTPLRAEADRLAAQIRIGGTERVDEGQLRAALDADPADHESRFALAQSLAARADYPDALEQYLEIVRRDRAFRDDGARKAMLDIFELIGSQHEIAQRYRSALAAVLFR